MRKANQSAMRQQKRISEACEVLKAIGMPNAQINDRSGLALLALLNLDSTSSWSNASDPLIGITPIMSFAEAQFGKKYAPNSRETFRRFTMHQFIEAGIALSNPDDPDRPINSPKWVYQVTPQALELFRTFGSKGWEAQLKVFMESNISLKDSYAKARSLNVIAVQLSDGTQLALSPGGQNVLVKEIVEQFAPRFTPGATILYVGDTGKKDALYDKEALAELGVRIDDHGKIPDVIIHYTAKKWLILIEAVTSHGPIDGKRQAELKRLFSDSRSGLVFVTTFLDRKTMREYLPEISWETEVWVADAPDHLIHFNGERFLGPYA